MQRALEDLLAGDSREFYLLVNASGDVLECDGRAQRHGIVAPISLRSIVPAGLEEKAAELCRQACQRAVDGWELPLTLGETLVTVLFTGRPYDGAAAMIGSLVLQDYADSMAQGSHAMHEIVDLNRQLTRQKQRLEESHHAIVNLHGELEQHADRMRAAAEVKGRLVAAVSHEFRTPLHSILGLSRLLLTGSDGPLNGEQETQVRFIRDSAEELTRLINDMLDLSQIDSGAAPLRLERFAVDEFLGALRGTMEPLAPADGDVALVIEPTHGIEIETDRGKLAQVMRNLVANALKFTRQGQVQVSVREDRDEVRLAVRDTGIGIAPADHERVFEEFARIENPLQENTKGNGLGLSLSRKLVEALGGRIELESDVGAGATFTVVIPKVHADANTYRALEEAAREVDPTRAPILVVEDDRHEVFAYERYLSMAGFQVLPCRTTQDARAQLERVRPSAILLDVMLEGEDTWNFLADVKRAPATHDIPVLVCTVMNRESRARALGADEFWLKPIDQDKLIRKLQMLSTSKTAKVLVVDDDAAARYLIRRFLSDTPYTLVESADGPGGVELARTEQPDVILLDFLLEDMTAFDVIDALKADPRTRMIPVIIVTSQVLPLEDRQRLSAHTEAILSKEHLSRELAINRIRDALRSVGVRSREPIRSGA